LNYYKLDLNSIISGLFIWSIFLSDFGIILGGQPIYFFQLLSFGYIIPYLIFNHSVDKGWFLFFVAAVVSILANGGLMLEARQFAGDAYPWTSIKAFLNIFLFYATYKTTLYAYNKINPNLFIYLSIFMIFYGFLELFLVSNQFVKECLQFLHTNPKALNKGLLSLLGREHSYGALGYMIAAVFLIYFYLSKSFTGYKSPLAVACAAILIFFVIYARSKSVFLGLVFFGVLLLILSLKQKKLTWTSLSVCCSSLIAIGFATLIVIQNNYFFDAYESVTGDIGSGSTFMRFSALSVALAQGYDNLIFGVGPGNFKLYFVEYIYKLDIPIVLELTTLTDPNLRVGSVDPANFFAGIFAEFGLITAATLFYIIFKRSLTLYLVKGVCLSNVSLSLLLSPIIFGAAFGFYYWAVSYFPFFLALLHLDYKRLTKTP